MSPKALRVMRLGLFVGILVTLVMTGIGSVLAPGDSRLRVLFPFALAVLVSSACVVDAYILNRPVVFIAQAALFFNGPLLG